MLIRREQIRILDGVPLQFFLARLEAAAMQELPAALLGADLRKRIRTGYDEALAARLRTERQIAAYILTKLKNDTNARQQ